ncbi:hypothetical protein FF38_14550 [Lucilia cuprina]|uniref:Uncharacterized protein n=1 Tax=Lucilia cuprina TaxID=7375 RepID=A0A0L0CLX9_LUCCU|nr:hypothetical protein FF38_14550 [Lucilia cuprina]
MAWKNLVGRYQNSRILVNSQLKTLFKLLNNPINPTLVVVSENQKAGKQMQGICCKDLASAPLHPMLIILLKGENINSCYMFSGETLYQRRKVGNLPPKVPGLSVLIIPYSTLVGRTQ